MRRPAARASASSSPRDSSALSVGASRSARPRARGRASSSSFLLATLIGGRRKVSARVLIVDDEAPIRRLCRGNVEAEQMEGLEAGDGPSGLEAARKERPDVILLDVMMPGLDGWRVAEELLEDPATNSIPIVFLTARAELRDRARGLDLGGLDYVTKPFNPVELAPLVRKLLTRIERGEGDELRRERIAELRAALG